MRFLIHGNAPSVATGYGVQVRHLADRLANAGHEVAISCTYGHQGPIGTWVSPKGHAIRLYPGGYETNGNDVIHNHAEHFFEGDLKGGWIITVLDVWCLVNPVLAEFNVLAWTPVDHEPTPPGVLAFFKRTNARPIAMSRFGEYQLRSSGLTPAYVPLMVDMDAYQPTPTLDTTGGALGGREVYGLPDDAFVVGMVAMNKGWSPSRKGFNEAFWSFAEFRRRHEDAVLFVHSEQFGAAEGVDLVELAKNCGIPEEAIVFSNQYAYRLGLPDYAMAAAYTAMDVLFAPSLGEGFCVPMIEAQACGVPVIANEFSAQMELIGPGWLVDGQPYWDQAQHSNYRVTLISSCVAALEEAHAAKESGALEAMAGECRALAASYEVDRIFDEMWLPLVESLTPPPPVLKPEMTNVDVLVPMIRTENRKRLFDSFSHTKPADVAHIYGGDADKTFSENVNSLVAKSTADWVLIVGDDVEFTDGWFEAAQAVSTTADVIGTNDSEPGRVRNPDVAAGRHADHFFMRRQYIDEEGGSLDGPGWAVPTCYTHWYTDKEVIELARARGVYVHAHDSVIIHHHPGYDGNEGERQADPIYMKAVEAADDDRRTFMKRAPLIEQFRS